MAGFDEGIDFLLDAPLVEREVLEDREPVWPRVRSMEHRLGELVLAQTELGRRARKPVPAQARVDLAGELGVAVEEGGEEARRAGELAVAGGVRKEVVDRMEDLVIATAAWPARAGGRHRQSGQH